jgi:signal transduction histidine kinase
MPAGGRISVAVKGATGGGVDILIDDEGAGIDEQTRGRLFEPFFTTKSHGTGLGLAITRQIVEAHSGTIACEARHESRGTRVWIHLPPDEPAALPVRSEAESSILPDRP